jgi:biotin carboxyl carrier protein
MKISFWLDNEEFRLTLEEKRENNIQVTLGQKKYRVSTEFLSASELLLNVNGKIYNIIIDFNSSCYSVYVKGRFFKIEKKLASQILRAQKIRLRKRDVKTSMPGRIVKILLHEGDRVKEGEAVLILEAMKMENEIKSPQSGVIKKIGPKAGSYVEGGSLLFSVE